MNCPHCDSPINRVVMTRTVPNKATIRRRKCKTCGEGWYTAEVPLPDEAIVHTRDSITDKRGIALHSQYRNITFTS